MNYKPYLKKADTKKRDVRKQERKKIFAYNHSLKRGKNEKEVK